MQSPDPVLSGDGASGMSTGVATIVAVLGVVGWLVCMRYAFWAYSNIGGGP